jgi:hypothetical protein
MTLLRTRQIGTAPAAARAQSMTERAIRAKLRLAQLRSIGITCKRILVLRSHYGGEGDRQKQRRSARYELED